MIVANVPGLFVGAVAGNRLGAIRDAKGKSVAAVFSDLGGQQKAEVSDPLLFESALNTLTSPLDSSSISHESSRLCAVKRADSVFFSAVGCCYNVHLYPPLM